MRRRELGSLRAVAHAVGISPSMADWRRVLAVDLTGTALLAEALRPLATAGTAMVCFASMAPLLAGEPDPAVAAILDDPLDERLPDRLRDTLGPAIEDSGRPDEVAAVVSFLLSEDASFLTGADVLIDGGVCAAVSS